MTESAQKSTRQTELELLERRYIDMVYAAAVRQMCGDGSAAEDVTGAVMLIMVQKARQGRLPEERFMAGWLLKVTRYAVLQSKRAAARRLRHETAAGQTREGNAPGNSVEDDVRAALDDALLRLKAIDREVVVRRYLRGESLAEVGVAVGMTENTAGRRAARAMEKLRTILARRGIAAPAGVVASVIGVEAAIKAPPACAAAVAITSMGAAGTSGLLAKGAIVMLATEKLKLAITAIVVFIFLGVGAAVVAVKLKGAADTSQAAAPPSTATNAVGAMAAPPQTHSNVRVNFPDGTHIELLGFHEEPVAGNSFLKTLGLTGSGSQPAADAPWWAPNGVACEAPPHEDKPRIGMDVPDGDRLIRVMLQGNKSLERQHVEIHIVPAEKDGYSSYDHQGVTMIEAVAAIPATQKTADVRIGLANGPWTDDIVYDVASDKSTSTPTADAMLDRVSITNEAGEACVYCSGRQVQTTDRDHEIVVMAGGSVLESSHGRGDLFSDAGGKDYFNCAAGEITQVKFRSRPYQFMTVKNVSVAPAATATNVEITSDAPAR